MESWFQRIFLASALLLSLPLIAEEKQAGEDDDVLEAVIQPDITRREINASKIDTENFEFGFAAGVMSVEDFGTNNSIALRMAYHISEDWFLEGSYGTTKTSKTSHEILGSINLLTDEERNLNYLDMSLGLNLFPGEIFLGENHAYNASMYVIGGAGSTDFGGDQYFTINYGAGARILATDWAALRLGFSNRIFTHSILGPDKTIQNLEASIGLSLFF